MESCGQLYLKSNKSKSVWFGFWLKKTVTVPLITKQPLEIEETLFWPLSNKKVTLELLPKLRFPSKNVVFVICKEELNEIELEELFL